MQHVTPQPYEDSFRNGQRKCAEVAAEVAMAEMERVHLDAFALDYVPEEWRAMSRRRFAAARAEYERAKTILNTWEEVA